MKPLIYFEDCKNFSIKGVKLTKSAFWTVHLVGCNGGIIENIIIDNNLKMTNCDGIDPDHSKNITIKNCLISSADDCIVLKSTSSAIKYGNTENIIVSDCTLTSTSAAIKIGSETEGDFNNIKFNNIKIKNSNRGISIQLRDKGNISNIEFNNIDIETKRFSPIHWWGKAEAIAISAIRRKKDSLVGMISNIKFNNINSIGENGILIYGENNINNIIFSNISVSIVRKTNWKKEGIDLRPSIYSILKGTPKVLYIRNAKDILFDGLSYYIDSNMKKIVNEELDIKDSRTIIK
ncbi:MAG: glycosyl hydrolase family 28 protein [Anaeroplasmataceae bacterium]